MNRNRLSCLIVGAVIGAGAIVCTTNTKVHAKPVNEVNYFIRRPRIKKRCRFFS